MTHIPGLNDGRRGPRVGITGTLDTPVTRRPGRLKLRAVNANVEVQARNANPPAVPVLAIGEARVPCMMLEFGDPYRREQGHPTASVAAPVFSGWVQQEQLWVVPVEDTHVYRARDRVDVEAIDEDGWAVVIGHDGYRTVHENHLTRR